MVSTIRYLLLRIFYAKNKTNFQYCCSNKKKNIFFHFIHYLLHEMGSVKLLKIRVKIETSISPSHIDFLL